MAASANDACTRRRAVGERRGCSVDGGPAFPPSRHGKERWVAPTGRKEAIRVYRIMKRKREFGECLVSSSA